MVIQMLKNKYRIFVNPCGGDLANNILRVTHIGNTTIYFGVIEDDEVIKTFRISTRKDALADEYAIKIKEVLGSNLEITKIDSVILSSVVPEITEEIEKAINKVLNIDVVVLKRDIKTVLGLDELGSDLSADSTGAIAKYGTPCLVFDMGTATTCSVINKEGNYIGCIICPGIKTAMNALIGNASQLSNFNLGNPKKVVANTTIDCINSGVIYGHSEMINGLRKKVEEETGEKYKVILTGGNSDYVYNYVDGDIIQDKNLIFYGLNKLYKNK